MMTDTELRIYNEACAAVVAGNRTRLAQALRVARRYDQWERHSYSHEAYYTFAALTSRTKAHCEYIGWPIRLRPNGRYL